MKSLGGVRSWTRMLVPIMSFWVDCAHAQARNSSIDCTLGTCGTQQVSSNGSAPLAFGSLLPNGIAAAAGGLLYLSSPTTKEASLLDSFTYFTVKVLGNRKTAAPVDGSSAAAAFQSPAGMAGTNETTFVADTLNFCIRKIDSSGNVATVEVGTPGWPSEQQGSDGIGTSAQFDHLVALTLSSNGKEVYVADGNRIRKVDLTTNTLTTIAGSGAAGVGTNAEFSRPMGVALSEANSTLFVADFDGHRIRSVSLASGEVSTLAGSYWAAGSVDGQGSDARFESPSAIMISPNGEEVLVVDYSARTLRAVEVSTGATRTLAITGAGPTALAITPDPIPYIVISREGGLERVLPRCFNGFYRERNGQCYACTSQCTQNRTVVAACNGIDDLLCV